MVRKSDQELAGLAVVYGAYVGEVIRHGETKARWGRDHPAAGPNSYPLFWGAGDACSFPLAWCQKRLQNGDEDSIVYKFQVMEAERRKKTG